MEIRFQLVALDCPDPVTLARFYGALLDRDLVIDDGDDPLEPEWVDLASDGGPTLAFQRVAHYVAPTWPDGPVPQQLHLDFLVDDLLDGEARAIALGATLAAHQPGRDFRVFLDPAGHPFCLVRAGAAAEGSPPHP